MKFRPTLLVFGLALTAAVATTAQAEGNVAEGKSRAYTCHGCHGIESYKNAFPNYSVPKLGGQNAKYIENALKAYASGERSHPTMFSQASGMTDEARADLAAFLAGEPTQRSGQVVGTPPPATQTCVACHGVDGGQTVSDEYPKLAGQNADYIVQALKDYKSGKRKNPVMAGIIGGVDEQDFEAIAQFFAQQPGLCTTDKIAKRGKCD
ncbi:MAG TPA: c-type cytochrome [Steroidobacteraceae bacterium]